MLETIVTTNKDLNRVLKKQYNTETLPFDHEEEVWSYLRMQECIKWCTHERSRLKWKPKEIRAFANKILKIPHITTRERLQNVIQRVKAEEKYIGIMIKQTIEKDYDTNFMFKGLNILKTMNLSCPEFKMEDSTKNLLKTCLEGKKVRIHHLLQYAKIPFQIKLSKGTLIIIKEENWQRIEIINKELTTEEISEMDEYWITKRSEDEMLAENTPCLKITLNEDVKDSKRKSPEIKEKAKNNQVKQKDKNDEIKVNKDANDINEYIYQREKSQSLKKLETFIENEMKNVYDELLNNDILSSDDTDTDEEDKRVSYKR